jgi:hypothetical protein
MTENDMIDKLEKIILNLEQRGLDTNSIKQFFDVGEWLIAFEGVEKIYELKKIEKSNDFEEVYNFFY